MAARWSLHAVLVVLLLTGSGCTKPSDASPGTMTFTVLVPENTPAGDTVWIYYGPFSQKMERVGGREFRLAINGTPEEAVQYRYARNGYNFRTAEFLAPTAAEPDRDTNNFFFTKKGREVRFVPGGEQRDVVDRWRWFPSGPLPDNTTALEPRGPFLPRVGGAEFRSGQTIEDLYEDAYADFIDATARRLVDQGFNWVELDPPWQWTEEDGLPRVHNDKANNPNYPDDATFLRELRSYTGRGVKAMVAPQLCCTEISTNDRSEAWWDAYFSETERFLTHFAALAEQGGASAFSYAVPMLDRPDAGARWTHVFDAVRAHFNGSVGEMVWILGPEVSPDPGTIPDPASISWASAVDFFLVHSDFPLSSQDDPSDAELLGGARRVANGTKALHDRFGKPIVLRNGYFNVQYAWKGQEFYSIGSVPWIADPEAKLQESVYRLDLDDHARTVDAQFRAIAESPWIVGYFHFGYTHWNDPLSPWMSIREKPAEDAWRKWNERILG